MEKIKLEIENIKEFKKLLKNSYDIVNNQIINTFNILLPKMKCRKIIDWDYLNPDYDIPKNYNSILGKLPEIQESILIKKGIFREDLFINSIHLNIYFSLDKEIYGEIENFLYKDVVYSFMPCFLKEYRVNIINNKYCIGFPLDFLYMNNEEILNIIKI